MSEYLSEDDKITCHNGGCNWTGTVAELTYEDDEYTCPKCQADQWWFYTGSEGGGQDAAGTDTDEIG